MEDETGVTVNFTEIISYTAATMVAIITIGRVLLGYALRD